MISIEEGLERVAVRAAAAIGGDFMPAETVALTEASGRILRQEIRAETDSPPFDRSIRDGFALRASDVARAPADLEVIGESRAGSSFDGRVAQGQAVEIMTGAEVPAGADAVVMVERTERKAGHVRILEAPRAGQSIQRRGTECREGDRILEPSREIRAAELGVLASVGCSAVQVSRKPRVAILSTGDELVGVDDTPGPAQIRNSNSYTLHAQVLEAGGEPEILPIARDRAEDLTSAVREGLTRDILVASGGVSMGKYDLVAGVLAGEGVQIDFDRVAMKPGKPTVFGCRDRTFVFGLPGNPVSTIVSFQLFVRPLIRMLLHAAPEADSVREAVLQEDVRCDPVRAACLPAAVRFAEGGYRIEPVEWKGSSDLVGLVRANAYMLVPRREGTLESGTRVSFIPMPAGC